MDIEEVRKYKQEKCNQMPYKTCRECNKSWESVENCDRDTS